jgi:hypothetical protein
MAASSSTGTATSTRIGRPTAAAMAAAQHDGTEALDAVAGDEAEPFDCPCVGSLGNPIVNQDVDCQTGAFRRRDDHRDVG